MVIMSKILIGFGSRLLINNYHFVILLSPVYDNVIGLCALTNRPNLFLLEKAADESTF